VTLLGTVALAVIGLLVVYPVVILVASSFQVGQFGTLTHLGFDNWTSAFSAGVFGCGSSDQPSRIAGDAQHPAAVDPPAESSDR